MKLAALLSWLLFVFVPHGIKNYRADADSIVGKYWTPKKDGKIEIFKAGDKYAGKIIWGTRPAKDVHNPDPALRSRDVIGSVFLYNFVYDDGEYIDGKVYDPTSGKTYSCKMWLNGENLYVKGYLGISLLGRSELFERIK